MAFAPAGPSATRKTNPPGRFWRKKTAREILSYPAPKNKNPNVSANFVNIAVRGRLRKTPHTAPQFF